LFSTFLLWHHRAKGSRQMKWLLKFLVTILVATDTLAPSTTLLAQQTAPQSSEQPKAQVAYITCTGKRYHRQGCGHLSKGAIPMSLSDAKNRGYTACKVCKPA
jgi:hypothetical protein